MAHPTVDLRGDGCGYASRATAGAWCSAERLTASVTIAKQTRERAVSQCIWLLDLTVMAWLYMLSFEPFWRFMLTGQCSQVSNVSTSVLCSVIAGGERPGSERC